MTKRPRVLLADDNTGIHAAVKRLLKPSCDVVGCALDSVSLFDAVSQLDPEVVLLDLSLPGGLNGLEICRRMKTIRPDVQVVVFTARDDAEIVRSVREAGAAGFVWKLDAATDLVPTIQAVLTRTASGPTRTASRPAPGE